MTKKWGDVRADILLKYPGTPLGLLDRYGNARLQKILDSDDAWSRLKGTGTILVVAKYDTGTIAVSAGGTTLTGTSTVWTATMTGRRIRIAGRPEWYVFTYVSATSGTIDKPYEGTAETAAAYRIWQPLYSLPSDVGYLESISVPSLRRDLDATTQEELDEADPARELYETPYAYAPTEDDSSELNQIELYPGPITAEGLPFRYKKKVDRLTDSESLIPDWINENAILHGVCFDLGGEQKDEDEFNSLVGLMKTNDFLNRPKKRLRADSRYTNHRVRRTYRGRGPDRNWNEA